MTVKYSGTDFCPIKPEIARFLSDLLFFRTIERQAPVGEKGKLS